MSELAAAALSIAAAAFAAYGACRDLRCALWPARFAAAAFGLSGAILAPGLLDSPLPRVAPSLLLPFALTGVFSRERRRWPILALSVLCLAARWRAPAAPAQTSTALLEAFALAVLAGLGAQRLWDGEGGPAFTCGAAAALALALARAPRDAATLLVEALPAAAALALVLLTSREVRARAGVAALIALFGFQRAGEIRLGVAATPAVRVSAAPRR